MPAIRDPLPTFASHLAVADRAFAALTCPPDPLSLDCATVGGVPGPQLGLPAGPVPLPELRRRLLDRSCGR
jgi:hypothetical protein